MRAQDPNGRPGAEVLTDAATSPGLDAPVAAPGDGRCRLLLLHRPRLVRADGTEVALNEKDAALLALIAIESRVGRQRAAHMLWPTTGSTDGGNAPKALNNLRQRVFRINRHAGTEIIRQAGALELSDAVTHDLDPDDDALLAGHAQGELLGVHDYESSGELGQWVDGARQRWRTTRSDRSIGLAMRLERAGRLCDALVIGTRLVVEEPLSEHASRLLMRLHHTRGDRGAALSEFERCRCALYEQLGDVPTLETVELAQVIASAETDSPARRLALPLALRHPPRTVGRDDVLLHAEVHWERDGVVLLLGSAGIGKSRVTQELVKRWGIQTNVSCRSESATASFGMLGAIASALAPAVRDRLSPDEHAWLEWLVDPQHAGRHTPPAQRGKSEQVFSGLLDHAVASGVTAIALEDLHYADAPSLQVLCAQLPAPGRAKAPHAMQWLLSCRDSGLPAELARWLDNRPLGAHPAVLLPPLDEVATRDFLRSLGVAKSHPQAATALHAHCGGHPLYMLQVLRQLQLAGDLNEGLWPAVLPLPDDAMASASQRLARADSSTQQLAYIAALCGPDFTAELMSRLMKQSAAELLAPWRRLEDLHIFGVNGFAHDLVREAVLAAIPKALKPLLHREIAQALGQCGADPLRQALHWVAGGEPARAAHAFEQAAALAQRCGLAQQAIECLAQASAAHRNGGKAGSAFDCDWRRGHLMIDAAPLNQAHALAAALSRDAQSQEQQALAAEVLARVRIELQDTGALADAERALTLAEGLPGSADALVLRLRSRLVYGCALSQIGRHRDAMAEFDRIGASEALPDEDFVFRLASDRASVLAIVGRRDEAVAVQRGALERALSDRHYARAAYAAGFCATHLGYLCRVQDALILAEQSIALAHQAGSDRGQVLVDEMGRAGNLGDLGRFGEALDISDRVIADLRASGQLLWAANAANDRAVIFMRLGRPDLAQHMLDNLPDELPLWVRASRRLVQARLQQWQGRDGRALVEEAASMFERCELDPHDYPRRKIALEAARVHGPAAVLDEARATIEWSMAHRHVALERYARMVLIQALTDLGDVPEAANQARLLALHDGVCTQAFGFYLPQLLLVCSQALLAADDRSTGVPLLQAAVTWVEDRCARHVPPDLRTGFMLRNPINQQLVQLGQTVLSHS